MANNTIIRWRPIWQIWLPIVFFVIPVILEKEMLGTYFTPFVYALLVFVVGIIYYLRMRLWQAIVLMSMTSITISAYFLAARPEKIEYMIYLLGLDPGPYFVLWLKTYLTVPIWLVFLITNSVIFYTLGPIMAKALNLEKTAIRLFKLAAREVSGELNGFTGRPFQAGHHPYARNEVIGFASYLEQKKICLAEFPGNGIKLIFSMGISPLNKKYRDKLSYVSFGEDGKLSVFISEQDYRQYKKEYTFDQLCDLMGKTFLRFAQYYKDGLDKQITAELKSV